MLSLVKQYEDVYFICWLIYLAFVWYGSYKEYSVWLISILGLIFLSPLIIDGIIGLTTGSGSIGHNISLLFATFIVFVGSTINIARIKSYFTKKKLTKCISQLKEESWFINLYSDYRYSHIIDTNSRVYEILVKQGNVERLREDLDFREEFINLVLKEHRLYIWGRE